MCWVLDVAVETQVTNVGRTLSPTSTCRVGLESPTYVLHKVPLRQIQKLQREVFHLAAGLSQALDKMVVGEQGWYGGEEAGSGVDQRFADAGSDGGDGGGGRGADRGEGVHDSPYRAE